VDLSRLPEPTSQIAQERVAPGLPSRNFLVAVAVLATLFLVVALWLSRFPANHVLPAESGAAPLPGSFTYPIGLHPARIVSAVFGAAAVAATCLVARRLLHNDTAALLAGGLVALDPALLAVSRLALPDTLALASLLAALACFLAIPVSIHWLGAGLLAFAALAEPRTLLWSLPLLWMVLMRGHIYAAPRHLTLAALQTVAAPLLGVLLHLLTNGGIVGLPCRVPIQSSLALTSSIGYGGVVAIHNPITWFGGLGAILLLGGTALAIVARQFRIARLPGRVQMRLADPLPGTHARILWLLLLAVLAPFPMVWLPLFAIALASGISLLAEDAPGFGAVVALVTLLFGVLGLLRVWGLVSGTGGQVTSLVPWSHVIGC
jgi:hypothetical protein